MGIGVACLKWRLKICLIWRPIFEKRGKPHHSTIILKLKHWLHSTMHESEWIYENNQVNVWNPCCFVAGALLQRCINKTWMKRGGVLISRFSSLAATAVSFRVTRGLWKNLKHVLKLELGRGKSDIIGVSRAFFSQRFLFVHHWKSVLIEFSKNVNFISIFVKASL